MRRRRSGLNDVDILWLNADEGGLAFVEVEFGLAVIGEKGAEFEAAFGHESEIIDGTLEDFHGNAGGE